MRTATLLLLALAVALPGCVERKMFIESDPPGADVFLEDEPVGGVTPAEVAFDWGGQRRVTLVMPGYRVLDAVADVEEPWYTHFPLDVFAEFVWPFTIEDHQTFTFELEPYHPLDERLTDEQRAEIRRRMEELKLRADEYRAGGSEGPGGVSEPTKPARPAKSDDGKSEN